MTGASPPDTGSASPRACAASVSADTDRSSTWRPPSRRRVPASMIDRRPGAGGPGAPMTSIGFQIVTPDERWLAALWPSVRAPLPDPPARVLEIGCGPAGGFVAKLQAAGYTATGIDPEAPDGPAFRQVEFERYQATEPADAIIAF